MGISEILASIDLEIAQLQQARALVGGRTALALKRRPGRPKKNAAAFGPAAAKPVLKKKRNITPEGRKRIAEAVKRRWAEQKKAIAAKRA